MPAICQKSAAMFYKLFTASTLFAMSSVMAFAQRTDIEPMLTTKWDQSVGISVVSDKFGFYTPAGCVATAVAQTMYYWYQKEGFEGNQTATIPAYKVQYELRDDTVQQPFGPLEPTTFDWQNMDGNDVKPRKELMERIGYALHMQYAPSASDSYLAEIPCALRDYFGYDKGVHAAYRQDYTAQEWDDLIYSELAAGRPVVFGGCRASSSSNVGHCFVADGYDAKTGRYHFNWGWGSGGDYCPLDSIYASGNDFNMYVDVVVGFQPPRTGSEPYTDGAPRLSCTDITFSGVQSYTRQKRTDDFTGVNIFNAVFNRLDQPTSMEGRAHYPDFDMGLGLYASDGTLLSVIASRHYGEMLIRDGFGDEICWNGLNFGAELPYGDYQIRAISRVHGNEEWLPDRGYERHYITARISEQSLTLLPSAYLAIEDGKLVNRGTEETTGAMFLWADGSSSYSSVQTAVAPGSALSTDGYAQMASDHKAQNRLYQSAPSTYIALSDSIGRLFDDANVLIGNDLDFSVTLANKGSTTYSGSISASIGTSAAQQSQTVSAEAGKSTTVHFSFSSLDYDKRYTLTVKSGNTSIDTTFTVSHGIVMGYGDGSQSYITDGGAMTVADNAVWVDARYTATAEAITPSSNPNCLYVLASGATSPSALSGSNIVIGSEAQQITLTDNQYGIDTPVRFTAASISYTRTFTEGNNGTSAHWSTLSLPFAAQSVGGDNCHGWFTSRSDQGKNIWLMKFSRMDNGTVYFKYAGSTLESATPYIITVAADAWGDRWNLVGHPITFYGSNAVISPKSRAITTHDTDDFIGRSFSLPRHYIYALNDDGDNFERQEHVAEFPAFRGYFLLFGSSASSAKAMKIAIDDGMPTGIDTLPQPSDRSGIWTDTAGRRLKAKPSQPGVYIFGGRKILVE